MDDVEKYGSEVIVSDELNEIFEQKHHLVSTVGEHTLRVVTSSVLICYMLKKLNVAVSLPVVIVGALCHDLGMSGREYGIKHPKESVKIADNIVSDMDEKTESVIRFHMRPLGDPKHIESVIVSLADKYNAVKDIFMGSAIRETGPKYALIRFGKWLYSPT